jgi:aspartate kinase
MPTPSSQSNAPSRDSHTGWIVLKFGGTSVSTRLRWDKIGAIAAAHRREGKRVLIVVSALSGITDKLKAITEAAADAAQRSALRDEILARHQAMFAELDLSDHAPMRYWLERLDALVANVRAEAGGLPWQAEVLALGEQMSSTLGVAYLNASGLGVHWLDAREHLLSVPLPNQNAWGRYLSASVPTPFDPALAETLAARGDVFVTQGFMARNAERETVILGRGGSDTSASYFGALLKAEKVEIWTDVAGMFSANPRQVPNARLLARLDYEEAQEIATTGAKVLHPRCINPLREARVPLLIKDTNHPHMAGTEIAASAADAAPSVKAISSRSGITLIAMESIGMWQQVGFLADVFEHFKRHGLSIDLISSAETNVTVSLDPSENLVNTDVLSALCTDLAKVCRVKVIAPCAAITLVGRGMRSMLHRLSAVLAEFGPQRVHLITQSSNNLNLTFVVDEEVAADLVPRLHDLLIKAEAMRVEDAAVFGPSWRELYTKDQSVQSAPWWRERRGELLAIAQATFTTWPACARVHRRCARRFPAWIAGSTRSRRMRTPRCWMKSQGRASALNACRRAKSSEWPGRRVVRPTACCSRRTSRRAANMLTPTRKGGSSLSTTCTRWRIGAKSSCVWIWVWAVAITTRSRPAVRNPSSVSHSTNWRNSSGWPRIMVCASPACMRTWARESWMLRTGKMCTSNSPVSPKKSAACAHSISAVASAFPRVETSRRWILRRSAQHWPRSRPPTRNSNCGPSLAAIWLRMQACCWRTLPNSSAKAMYATSVAMPA